ncbi:MAG: hypothetical protein L3J03_09445 [Desulfobacterales bacterium]|nr:hypothetical protein [Desulfobacterales bacterium]
MAATGGKTNYFPAISFWLVGLFFMVAGGWNVYDAVLAGEPLAGCLVALFFMVLFAAVAIVYGNFLFKEALAGPVGPEKSSIFQRVHPARVIGLLAYGLIPILFIYLSADSRSYNSRREAALRQLRPAVLQYLADHGQVPRELQALVPGYLEEIPESSLFDPDTDPARRVEYLPMRKTARFHYRLVRLPGFETDWYYDIVTGKQWPGK